MLFVKIDGVTVDLTEDYDREAAQEFMRETGNARAQVWESRVHRRVEDLEAAGFAGARELRGVFLLATAE